ncbi:MAG: hypothetical protein ACE5HW_06855, partial [Candidatus Methanofastidiosia archaeon]
KGAVSEMKEVQCSWCRRVFSRKAPEGGVHCDVCGKFYKEGIVKMRRCECGRWACFEVRSFAWIDTGCWIGERCRNCVKGK